MSDAYALFIYASPRRPQRGRPSLGTCPRLNQRPRRPVTAVAAYPRKSPTAKPALRVRMPMKAITRCQTSSPGSVAKRPRAQRRVGASNQTHDCQELVVKVTPPLIQFRVRGTSRGVARRGRRAPVSYGTVW